MSDWVIVQRLFLTAVLAGCIGYERERLGRAAGLRTHILAGVGACLIMLTGLHIMEALQGAAEVDPTRMAAQVVSGIGFLGAGAILRDRASVRGLTTAASLWAVAGLGLAAGSGFLSGAVAATVIMLVTLFGMRQLDRRIRHERQGS
jgi:putative Mg2+ transporter-C (MgtC) family protein